MKIVMILLLCSSCAWNKFELFKDSEKDYTQSSNDKLEQLGVEKELLDKYTVDQPIKKEEINNDSEKKSTNSSVTKLKPLDPVKKNNSKKSSKLELSKKAEAILPNKLPEGYPEDFSKISAEAKSIWDKFLPVFEENEKNVLDIDYLGMTVGKIIVGYSGIKIMNQQEVYHFTARFKSAPFYSALYELDDKVDTFVRKNDFKALRYNLVQRESKQNVDEVQLFDRDKLFTQAFATISKDKGTKVRKKEWSGFIPDYSIDAFSVIFLLRSLPLNVGDIYKVPVVNKGKVLILTCEVEAFEQISTKIGKVDAIRLKAETKYSGRTLKSGEMVFWFSKNKNRELLRAKAKINLGSVYAEKASDG